MKICMAALMSTFGISVQAQVLLSGITGGDSGNYTYAQNFDSLPSSSGFSTWADNVTLSGWYMRRQTANSVVSGNFLTQQNTSNSLVPVNWGLTNATDRSLGAQVSNNVSSSPVALGVSIFNDTAYGVSLSGISFVGEQWRQTNIAQTISFSYQISTTAITDPNSASALPSGWTNVAALDFTTPQTGANSFIDGTLSVNQRLVDVDDLSIPTLNPGEYIFLRWYFSPLGASASSLAGASIDNLAISLTVVPEPGSLSLLLVVGCFVVLYLRRNFRHRC